MRLAIMQPYFFPYIGYFQLMKAVDEFVIYDNLKFTKQGWINRNRILVNGQSNYVTVPLKKDSDFLNIDKRLLADTWSKDKIKLQNRINQAYKKSPYFEDVYPIIEDCLNFVGNNLFSLIFYSLISVKNYLGIHTPFVISSAVPVDFNLKAEKLVIEICKARRTDTYINPIGGIEIYDFSNFKKHGINLFFQRSKEIIYHQFDNHFIPQLSIIDVMMFNSREKISEVLKQYDLIKEKSIVQESVI